MDCFDVMSEFSLALYVKIKELLAHLESIGVVDRFSELV